MDKIDITPSSLLDKRILADDFCIVNTDCETAMKQKNSLNYEDVFYLCSVVI